MMSVIVKKTSGRYRLVLWNPENKSIVPILCNPLTGEILPVSEKKGVGADLAVLDSYLLEHFKNELELRTLLQSFGYSLTDATMLQFAYQHNGNTKLLELVFQSQQLHDLALLCQSYKQRYNEYITHNYLSPKELRKLIVKDMSQEKLWKQFYESIIQQIHEKDFYIYLKQSLLIGDRIFSFIQDYLIYEGKSRIEEQEAFSVAKHHLIDTFTSYKPIRGMIVARKNYMKPSQSDIISWNEDSIIPISNAALFYLESHPYFESLSDTEKQALIFELLKSPSAGYQKKKS